MRTIESYKKHITGTVTKCGSSWIICQKESLLGTEYLITPHQCKSNYCPQCRPRNLIQTRKMLYNTLATERWRLVTLTLPDHSANVLETLCKLKKQFNLFTKRLRRAYPEIKFVRAIEVHQSGFPHIHLIINRYVPKGFLSKAWHDIGGGYTDIRVNRKCSICGGKLPCAEHPGNHKFNFKQAARYLTEEFEKKFQDPHRLGEVFWQAGTKSITCSRNISFKPVQSEWEFKGIAKSPADAMYYFDYMKYRAKEGEAPTPTVRSFDNDRAMIFGYGFSQQQQQKGK